MIQLHYSYTIDYDNKTIFLNIYTEDKSFLRSYTLLKTTELTEELLYKYEAQFMKEYEDVNCTKEC